jgi:sulfate permease, SulP family
MKLRETRLFPPAQWFAEYRAGWLRHDVIAGVTLAAYAIPVSLAYAALAGLPPQVGVYGYMLGGLGYALLGASRQLAVGPTSAISLMIAATVGALAGGDYVRYAQIASLAAFTVAVLCLIAWIFRLSMLVRLISDSILVGFKAGAGLTIIMTQLPSLFGVAGGGRNFFDRLIMLVGQLHGIHWIVLAVGLVAILLLLFGERVLPGRPVGLAVVVLSILVATAFGLPALGVPVTGEIPKGLPSLAMPTFGLLDFDELFPLAAGILLLAYVEGVSAARSFAAKHGYALDVRQEFLGLGAANLGASLGHGYPVAGGLSQSAVNDQAGAKTPLALIICSLTLAICLLFLTGLLTNLPKAVLAAIVFTAVYKLVDVAALKRMWRISRIDFFAAAIALVSVLLLGILQGILLAALASIFLLLARASQPNIAFLGRVPGTGRYADSATRTSSCLPGLSPSARKRRCFTSMRKQSLTPCWQGSRQRQIPSWSSAVFRPRLSSIWPAPGCCTISMTSLPRAASPSRSSAPADRSATSCRQMVSPTRLTAPTGPEGWTVCSAI